MGRGSWEHRWLFLSRAPRAAPGTPPLRSAAPAPPHPGAYRRAPRPAPAAGPGWGRRRAQRGAGGLQASASLQEHRGDSFLPLLSGQSDASQANADFSLRCLISASYLPEAATQKKMTLKGYDFLLHTKLVILGLLFLFPLFYSLSPVPSPEQEKKKRSYISSGSVFMGISLGLPFFFISF